MVYPGPKAPRSTEDVALSTALTTPLSAPVQHTDWALVQACVAGESAAFRPLVERYQRLAFSVALRLLASRADAEDAVQHAFVEAYRALHRFDGSAHPHAFRVWLLRIVVNRAKDMLKSKQRQEASLEDDGETLLAPVFATASPDPEGEASAHAAQRALQKALLRLPEKYRTALVLKDVEDLSYEDMRSILRLPITTLKIRVVRARAMMRDALETVAPDYASGFSP